MIYFTSDTHFGHRNIINLCNRPFKTVEEMDEYIVDRWNDFIPPGAEVWHLGDFCFPRSGRNADWYLKRLNGSINIVWGNHDRDTRKDYSHLFASCQDYKEIKVQLRDGNPQKIILCHYPMRSWNKSHAGSWMLFGHEHGSFNNKPWGLSFDVGVDSWSYCPVPLIAVENKINNIIEKGLAQTGGQHHGRLNIK